MSIAAGELLDRIARCAGIDAIYGAPTPVGTMAVVPTPDGVAETFALAHQRVHGARAGVHLGRGVFRFPGAQEIPPVSVEAGTADDLMGALPHLASGGEVVLRITVDLAEPVDDLAPQRGAPGDGWMDPTPEVIDALREADTVSVLAGPGVVRHDAVPGLHDLAVKANLGVLNTWGAKGVFHWRSRHHLATVGLQADDFALGGLGDVDLIIGTGLDQGESPDARWRLAPSLVVPPGALARLAEICPAAAADAPIVMPPLRVRLAGVTQRGWEVEQSPLPPTRVTLHYGECVSAGTLVAADAGTAGFWVARTLGTTRLGGVIVPSLPIPGFAAACVAVWRLRHPSRTGLAVVDAAAGGQTADVVDAARRLGIVVPVEAWDPDGEQLDAQAHRDRLSRMINGGAPATAAVPSLATHQGQLAEMVDAAGPVVAWTQPA
jgi:Thiamine pyrophosphate enzyme, central domain